MKKTKSLFSQLHEANEKIKSLENKCDILKKELDNLNHLMPLKEHSTSEYLRIKELCQ